MSDLLSRYTHGAREGVWHELRQLGAEVRSPERIDEARAVCDEMARRAKQNVEVVVGRLVEQGYRFHTNDDEQTSVSPYLGPTARAAAHAAWLEERFGPVPLTLLSWVRIVGDVWLVGTHPLCPESAAADPLVLEPEGAKYPAESIANYFEQEHDAWTENGSDGPFTLPLAPDRLHKDNTSGGPPYGIVLPDACADALFTWEVPTSFIAYLNRVFRGGGFAWPLGGADGWRVARSLAKDLLPL